MSRAPATAFWIGFHWNGWDFKLLLPLSLGCVKIGFLTSFGTTLVFFGSGVVFLGESSNGNCKEDFICWVLLGQFRVLSLDDIFGFVTAQMLLLVAAIFLQFFLFLKELERENERENGREREWKLNSGFCLGYRGGERERKYIGEVRRVRGPTKVCKQRPRVSFVGM